MRSSFLIPLWLITFTNTGVNPACCNFTDPGPSHVFTRLSGLMVTTNNARRSITCCSISPSLAAAISSLVAESNRRIGPHRRQIFHMRYVMRQKIFALHDDFIIKDETGAHRFKVDGKVFTIGNKLSFQELNGGELAFIKQKLLSLSAKYEI